MKLTRLAETCKSGDCPTIYATDRGTIAVQGPIVTDAENLRLSPGEALVEIPDNVFMGAARARG